MPDANAVTYEVSGSVATIRLNRPDVLNAVNAGLREALLDALRRAQRDPAVKAILLGSTGRGFSAGADLTVEHEPEFSVEDELLQGYRPLLDEIRHASLPVIGVAPGVAAGVGAALLMVCDLVVMAEEARIYMAFSHIGLVPDGGATWLLYHYLGYQRAFELIVAGGSLDSTQCTEAGIANKVVPAAELEQTAARWAEELAARPAVSTAEAKKLLRAAATQSYEEIFVQEARAQHHCINSDESRAAIAEFKKKTQRA